jgi:hypothetical protein
MQVVHLLSNGEQVETRSTKSGYATHWVASRDALNQIGLRYPLGSEWGRSEHVLIVIFESVRLLLRKVRG